MYEDDEMRAREVLEIVPAEIQEWERELEGGEPPALMSQWMVTATIVAIVAFIALTVVVANRAIR